MRRAGFGGVGVLSGGHVSDTEVVMATGLESREAGSIGRHKGCDALVVHI